MNSLPEAAPVDSRLMKNSTSCTFPEIIKLFLHFFKKIIICLHPRVLRGEGVRAQQDLLLGAVEQEDKVAI